jgi:dihydrofolate synthase/folylpolyglutamate synthase
VRFEHLSEWLQWQEGVHPELIDLGLERVAAVLQQLDWRRPSCPIVTVGGTNGKGSSVALLESLLSCGGYRVGCFTTPHLRLYNERIRIAGQPISDAALLAAFERIDAARGRITLTAFEFCTLAALLALGSAQLDAIVLEIGMGGGRDAVNIVDPDVALLVSVALDHCQWLGADVEAIGREKAGIFRAGRPAVFGARRMPASVAAHAASLPTSLLQLGRDFDHRRDESSWNWLSPGSRHCALPPPALAGAIQFDNAAAVLAVLECLRDQLPLSHEAIVQGLTQVRLAGRFQRFAAGCEWIIDVAHNPAAAQALAAQLDEAGGRGRTLAVAGMLGDKDVAGIARALGRRIDGWIVAGLAGDRTVPPEQVACELKRGGANILATAPTVPAACAIAQDLATPSDRVVCFGSFRTVAAAWDWLEAQDAVHVVANPREQQG